LSASTPATPAVTGWVSIAQAAAALAVSRDTIRRMIDRGELYAERLGPRLIRVDLGSIRPVPLGPAESTIRIIRRPLGVTERIAAGGEE
jgi:excisionase family DNA binding protein